MESLAQHVKHAYRRLLQAPAFTAMAVFTLGVGIAANTAIFSVVKGVVLEPLPFEEPEALLALWYEAPGLDFPVLNQSPATYLTTRADTRLLEDVALWNEDEAQVLVGDEPEQVAMLTVTDGFLPVLGVDALIGRRFTAEDDQPGAAQTVMLTHRFWQSALGGDPDVVARR